MIHKSLSTRSKGKFLTCSHHRGFTLVELMMSIVLIAIGMTLALPSFRDQVEKRQVTNGAEQLASFINAAQGAAMKTNDEIWVSWWTHADSNEWCIGANRDAKCDCRENNACKINYQENDQEPEFVIDNSSAGDRDLVHAIVGGGEDNAYAFDPVRGLMVKLDDSLTIELRSNNDDFRLNLMVNNTGRVTLCSEDESHAVPGYEVCPPDAIQFVEAEL